MRLPTAFGLASLAVTVCHAVTFTSCSASQTATLQTAIDRAAAKAKIVVEYLEANPNGSEVWEAWFGTFSTARYNRVLTAWKKFAPDLATTFSYDCSCQSTAVIASIGGTYGDVKICSVYFDEKLVPATGHRSQWTNIIHEATHFRDTLHTQDYGYGVDYAREFALEDPEKAVSNADNHSVFAVEVPPYGP